MSNEVIFSDVEGIVVGEFIERKFAIIHTTGFGRVLVGSNNFIKEMQLGVWFRLNIVRNDGSMNHFNWSATCPWICRGPVNQIERKLCTRIASSISSGRPYPIVKSPILIGAVHSKNCIAYSPLLGRVVISINKVNRDLSTGDYMEAYLSSIPSDEKINGNCLWAVTSLTGEKLNDPVDWGGVRRVDVYYDSIVDHLCLLRTATRSDPILFGPIDYKIDGVDENVLRDLHKFTAWVGPSLPSGDPVRAFFVEPNEEPDNPKGTSEQTTNLLPHSIDGDSIPSTPSSCQGKELIMKVLQVPDFLNFLCVQDNELLAEMIGFVRQ